MTLPSGLLHVLVGSLLAAQGPAYVTEQVGPPRRFEAEMTLKLHAPRLKAAEWIVFAPRPPDLAGQKVLASSLRPGGKLEHELSPLHRPVLRGRVAVKDPALEKDLTVQVKYEVVLRELKLVEAGKAESPAPVAELPDEARKLALAPTKLINFNSAGFQKWLDAHKLRLRPGEGPVDFGRRTFLAVVKNFKYDYRSTMDRHADVTCQAGKSDCGGLSAVFVGALHNKIPARLRVGRWTLSQKQGEKLGDIFYGQEHVIAEFYAPGAGWVVVDCSSGLDDRTPARLQYFGRFWADFITLHLDNDLVLDSIYFGKETVPWMQGMMYWATGGGDLKGLTAKENWRVRKLP